MEAPASHHLDLYSYWLSKRGARIMPARGDINPAEISLLLPLLMVIEKTDGRFRYRQVGSAIVEAVGYDATGVTVGTYIAAPDTAAELRAIFEYVFTAGGPVFARGEYLHKTGGNINLSLFTAPLSEDGVAVDMSISTLAACFSAALKPGPRWLKGLPFKIGDAVEVRDRAELEKLCLEWERSCEVQPDHSSLP
jgi:hypothetical protein